MLYSNITDERLAIFQWGVIISASLVSAIWDVRSRRIPNMLTFPLLLAGLLWATCHGGLSSVAEAVGACVLLALPYVFLFVFANGGAGDAKLMGAIGAWLGFKQGIIVLCCVATAGIILAIIKSLIQRQARAVCTSVFVSMYTFIVSITGHKMQLINNLAVNEQSESMEVPYGVAILTGVIIAGVIVWCL